MITKDLGAVSAYAYAVEKGYTGTEAEYAELMASYATVAQQASQSAQSAGQSATNASQSATDAETAQGMAQQAATDAQSAQASAQGFAQSAQQSAQSASQSAQSAESAKDTAVDAVDGFAAGAQQALDDVNQAGDNWKNLAEAQALDSEAWAAGTRDGEDVGTQDETYHNNSKWYAEQGSASAQAAIEAAQTATRKAGEAAQSASAAAASAESIDPEKLIGAYPVDTATGAIASFSDGADNIPMKSVKIRIEPVQDLHGQDAPYPAGGGKNLLETSFEDRTVYGITITRTQEGGIAIKGTPTRDYSFVVGTVTLLPGTYDFWGFVDSGGSGSTYQIVYTGENMQTVYIASASSRSRTIESETVVTATVFVYETAGAVNTLIKPMVTVSGTQVDSFAPYSNICPISGWTGAKVTRCGKNLLDADEIVGGVLDANGVLSTQNVTINSKGGGKVDWTSTTAWRGVTSGYIEVRGGHTYRLSLTEMPSFVIYAWYAKDKSFMSRNTYGGDAFVSVTAPDGAMYLRITIQQSAAGTFSHNNLQLELGSTATDYEPYSGQTYDITFPSEVGTVYGGTLDVTTGVLMVDMAMVDLGTLNWMCYTGTSTIAPYFYANFGEIKSPGAPYIFPINAVCSQYPVVVRGSATVKDKTLFGDGTTTSISQIQIKDSAYTDASAFKSAMSGVQLVYELATPITYQLTPTEIRSLLGTNNVFADTGDSTVEYRADTKLYINRKIAEAVSALS